MEEHFILRVPQSVAERLQHVLDENQLSPSGTSIDISFAENGRSGFFKIGNEEFSASLLDLPCVVESFKTYDDNVLIKTADIGQIILVQDKNELLPEGPEYKHGLTPPMREARRRRFRKEPIVDPDLVQQVEDDLQSIMAGSRDVGVEVVEQDEDIDDITVGNGSLQPASKAVAPKVALMDKRQEKDDSSTESD